MVFSRHFNRFLVSAVAISMAGPALAHPGHGKGGGSHELVHYATEPLHIAPVALAALAGIAMAGLAAWYRRKV